MLNLKENDIVQVVKLGDPHFGEMGRVITSKKIPVTSEPGYIEQYILKFDEDIEHPYGNYFGDELAEIVREAEEPEEALPEMVEVKFNREAAFERSMYIEDMIRGWKSFVNNTDTAGMSEELKRKYSCAIKDIEEIARKEKESAVC